MSHKPKNHRQIIADLQSPDSVIESRPIEKSPQESPKTSPPKSTGEDAGLTWQPMFVVVLIAIGLLVLLGKILKLF